MINQLLYTSDASSAMNDAEWERIQRSTAIYNAVNGINGLCCYDGNGFLQLVEGRDDKVRDVMARIRRDHCHDNLDVVYDKPSEYARYGTFHMRFCKISDDPDERRREAERLIEPSLEPELKRLIFAWFERAPSV